MKKLSFILIVAMALIGTACTKSEAQSTETATRAASNQNKFEIAKVINESDIDPAIMEFVMTHFPQTGIFHCYQTQHYYKVKLDDRTHLEFTHSFEWVKVDCEHSTIYTSVPTSIVPEQITSYVTANFPGKAIEEIEKKSFGWEIEMKNGPEIKFDTNFNVINGGGNGGGNNSNFPEINTFVSTYFPQVSIQRVELDGNEIDVKLTDGTDIDFYLNFIWQSIDCEHATVYGSVPSELVPEQITDYVTANFPNNHIDQIEKKNNGNWEIELNNDYEIVFDANFNVIGGGGNGGGGNGGGNTSNYPEINTFVDTYFPQTSILKVERDGNKYEVELTDNTDINFNLSFEWTKIDCDESNVYGSVPTELVPVQITDYVTANFPNNHIDQIEKKYYGWDVELNNDHEIKFDSNFNVISGGGNGGGGNGGGNNSNYPEINTFVDTYFPQVSIRKVERDGNKYEVELTDNTDIDFNLSFEWKKIDCDDSNVYGSVPTELVPVQITDYVTANFPGKHIDSIEKKYNGWEIELSNGLEITFDSNFNVTGFDDKK